jgi:membrane protein
MSTAADVPKQVDDPTDLDRTDYKAAAKAAFKEMKEDDVPTLASAAAFRLFLSLFPSLVAAVGIFGLVTDPAELTGLLEQLSGLMPEVAVELIRGPLVQLSRNGSGAGFAAVAGIAGGIWAATGAAAGLMKALSRAWDAKETRKFVKMRLQALAICAALLVALAALIVLLVAGPQVEDALLGSAPPFVDAIATVLRYVLAVAVLVALFAFVYWLGPNRDHPSWEWLSPGAILGTVGWLVVSLGFTFYVQTFGNYNKTYGAIAGVVVLMLWLQLTMLIVLVGAEFNAEIERRKSLHDDVDAGIGFATPGAAGALIVGDPEAGASGIAEGKVDVTGTAGQPDGMDETAPIPAVVPAQAPAQPRRQGERTIVLPNAEAPDRKLAAGAAMLVGAAVYLGFARRRDTG